MTAERDALLASGGKDTVENADNTKLSQVMLELTTATSRVDLLSNDISVYESRMLQNDNQIGELRAEINGLQTERADLLARLEMLQTADSPPPVVVTDNSRNEIMTLKNQIASLQAKLAETTTPSESSSSKGLQQKLDLLEII
jgi:uncharacterized coiled-coil DUF342 family protein